MHVTSDDYFLIDNNKSKRYAVTFVVSVCVMLLVLMVPVKKYIQLNQEELIALTLTKSMPTLEKVTKEKEIKQKTIQAPPKQPELISKQTPQERIKKKPRATKLATIKVIQTMPKKQEFKQVTIKQTDLPTAATLLNTIKARVNVVELGNEFQAKTKREEDFVYKSVEQAEMFKEFKLINEDIDKPQYEMKFYSEGVEGSIERFMDKITYEKRFTTRFGTKIDCAAIALVIVACGWK